MKALITGGGGQLATDLKRHCRESGDEVVVVSRDELDITRAADVARLIELVRPSVVYNCGAWTDVDGCENDPARALEVNGFAVNTVGQCASEVGAHLVQVSTDYVFDGTKATPYVENDPPNPVSSYGRSKLVGEEAAIRLGASVVRTSWVISEHGGNMFSTVTRLLGAEGLLRFVEDQRGCPTWTTDLAVSMRELAGMRSEGIFHVTSGEAMSWFEFAQQVAEATGFDSGRVRAIRTVDLDPPRPALRPANSVLETTRPQVPARRTFQQHLVDASKRLDV